MRHGIYIDRTTRKRVGILWTAWYCSPWRCRFWLSQIAGSIKKQIKILNPKGKGNCKEMDIIKLKRGDIFTTKNPMMLGKIINFFQKIQALDNQSEYSHAGFIINGWGDTFESLWKIRKSHLSTYIGQKVLIGRLVGVTTEAIDESIREVMKEHEGIRYPWWRLPMYLFRPLAKYISLGMFLVCSELMFKHVKLSGVGHIGRWQGRNPDNAADFIKHADACEVIFEGILTDEILQTLTE